METRVEEKNNMVDILTCDGKQILLIGTAHVSRQSAKLVEDTIHEQNPDTVCVELCETRLASLKDADRWRNMDIVKVIKEKKALMLFMNLLLASFQKKMADKFDIKPGQEMINAIHAAEKINARLIPADREIQVTLSRVWRGMGFWEKIKFISSLVFSFGAADDIKEEDIEKMKQEDILQTLLADVKKTHPIIEKTLINERDQFLAEKIRTAPGEKIVAVVGAAHAPGIKKYLFSHDGIDISELNRIPPAGKAGQILKWLIPAVIFFLIVLGFSMKGKSAGADMIWIWIAAHGLLAGLGAILAMAHPLTILSAVLVAPLTSLNPMIAAGWVSGLVEAFTKKPKVKDLEAIPQDISSIKGFWRNNVTRILLVVVFTNLGSSIGTMTAVPLMLKLFN
ncbi:MAG: conjugal transfer protein TraB [Desulfobacterales bacterium RIFOXYA12_FULL_46_15]|nr:MAG: conjugal transfer protein TraB [Desulfobacula sp. GWF2_41_7]OGR28175.1 MAG: conjugal transfer protein TraB [Desulfobacterales bacterium RIFOXYA12_FULL_46_15]